MSLLRRLSGFGFVAIVMANGLTSASPAAKAEDLVDFLWGGSAEYGGSRSVVSFDPQYKPGQVIVSFSDRRLYWIMKPGVALTYPVAIPTGEARWQGVTSVTSKRVNPPWTPTPDMVRANPRLPRWVPGGHPMNPLGIRAMYLGTSAYRIHGTDAPWTIGQAVSHGCIRMTNEDVLDLYPRIPVGTRVTVTWQQFKTQTISDGSNIPRYTDRDSNPRAAEAPAPAQQSASAESSSSESSAYSYRSYGAGKGQMRTVASQSNSGGLENLFSWAQGPKPEPTPVADSAQQDQQDQQDQQASGDATRDDDDAVTKGANTVANADRKDVAASDDDTDIKPFEKPSKKVHQATATIDQSPSSSKAPEPKKKAASATSSAKKKPAATAASVTTPVKSSDPESDPTMAVPDPVKPTRDSEAVPAATHASATDAEVLPVQRASVQVQ